jgi:cytochrome b pre-mRNA-processing protein 3
MLRWLRKRSETARRAKELYGSVVTAARQPAFYGIVGVPDTPEGRFELVALHLYLALESLRVADPAADDLSQRTIEVFVEDMDDCMREMGVGDLTVPKKVKRAAAAFYERATTYGRDLIAGEESTLARSLGRSIFADGAGREDASRALAHYVRAASMALAAEPFEDWVRSGAAHRLLETSISSIRMTAT